MPAFIHKKSSTASDVPSTSQLSLGELAVNTYDGKLFTLKDVSGTQSIVDIVASNTTTNATHTGDATGATELTIKDNVALGGNPTTTTQSTSNSTTRIATTAFVQAAVDADISALIDSAPGALDTLNELAAALGDDASFSTTVTNSIAAKMPLAGGTFTGNITLANTKDILPATEGGSDLGASDNAWGDIFIADDRWLYFGDDADVSIGNDIDINSGDHANGLSIVRTAGGEDLNIYPAASAQSANEDMWRLKFADGGTYTMANRTSGSYVTKLSLTTAGSLDIANLTIAGAQGSDGEVLTSTGSGVGWEVTGDVTKVGNPADDQVGVWTGDGTIEGTSGLTYNGSLLDVRGDINIGASSYMTLTDNEIDISSGDLLIDVAGDITLSAAGNQINFSDASTIRATWNLDATPQLDITGDFKIEGSGQIDIDSGNSKDIVLDSARDIILDAVGGNIKFKGSGGNQLLFDMDTTAGEQIIQLRVNSDDLVFQQFDGHEVIRINDDRKLYFYDDGGESIHSDGTAIYISSGGAEIKLPTAAPGGNGYALTATTAGVASWTDVSSGSDIDISGTPVNNQVAIWTDNNTLEGDANFTFDSSYAQALIYSATNAPQLILKSTDADSNEGPVLTLSRVDTSPVDNALVGQIKWEATDYDNDPFGAAAITCEIADVTVSSKDTNLYFEVWKGNHYYGLQIGATGPSSVLGLKPAEDNAWNLGSSGKAWSDIYSRSYWAFNAGFFEGATDEMTWTTGGDNYTLQVGAGIAYTVTQTSSDQNLKNSISDFNTGLSLINQLQPKNYKFNEDYRSAYKIADENMIGMIAQDLESLSSNYVETSVSKHDSKSYLRPSMLFKHELHGALINAIKELSTKNDALEARLAILEAA